MNERVAVMLSDTGAGATVAADLTRRDVRVDCYTRLEELLEEHAPDAIPVLIFHLRDRPKGRLLEVIGRLAVEHPRIQMAVVSEVPLSLEVAEYIAGRGVDLLMTEPATATMEMLPDVVKGMHEKRHWSVAAC